MAGGPVSPSWVGVSLLVGVVGLLFAGVRLRGLRPGWPQAVVVLVALLASAVLMPLSRQLIEGHEAEYLDIALGQRGVDAGNAARLPAMQWLMWALGQIWPSAGWVRAWALGAGALGCVAWTAALERLAGRGVGLCAGLTLALWGNLAAWSSSAYNVVYPFACISASLWGLSLLIDGEDPLGAGLIAGVFGGLAVALRVDSLAVAPIGALLLLIQRPVSPGRWAPGLALGAGIAGVSLLALQGGEIPGQGELWSSFRMNRLLLVYFEPFQRLWVLPAVLIGAGLALKADWRRFGPVLLLAPFLHLSFSAFNDYGSRHLLAAGLALSAAVAFCVRERWAWPALAMAGLGLMASLWDTRVRFYAEEDALAQAVDPTLPEWRVDELGRCALITEDERIQGPHRTLSHFNLWDPQELADLQAQHGCVYWLMGVQDYRWSSLAVRDRALRIERAFEAEAVAVVKQEDLGYFAVVLRIDHARRWPRASPVRTLP